MEQNLILIGWGRPEYPAAGAVALEGLRGHADVFGTSRARLSQALSDRAMNYAETYIIGVGITKNFRETIEALKRLREAGKKVHWISRMDLEEAEPMLREEFGPSRGFTEVYVRKQGNTLAAVAGDYFKEANAQKYFKFCTPVPKKEEKSDKNVVAVFQRLFRAAGYYHREIHDDGLYGKVVKKLWETQKLEGVCGDKALMKQLEFFDKYGDDEIVGDHPSTKALIERIVKVAPCDSANVLILGETGTGKELIAKQIHRRSPRASGPLVVDNCACMDGDLINTRLFGYERGAYTDAKEMHRGLIEQANGGTLFLDEIGELPLEAQAKLLRVLDCHKVAREGGDIANQIDVDFRLVAATNRDLVQRVAEGKFREDLLQRIATVIVHTTPLRARREDIVKIAKYRWPKITRRPEARLTKAQNEALMSYDYPGNVRELNNILERANALGEEDFAALVAEQSDMMRALIAARQASQGQAAEVQVPNAQQPSAADSPFAALPEKREELLHLHAQYLYGKYRKLNVAAEKAGVTINTLKKQLNEQIHTGGTRMKELMLVVCVILAAGSLLAATSKQTFRDAQGRNMGSASTDSTGRTTFRDSLGRNQGTATVSGNRTTFRDSLGRNQGTATTDSSGRTTYRDAQGRMMGTARTDSTGKVTYRDAQGRLQGTATTDSSGRTTYRDAQGRLQGTKK